MSTDELAAVVLQQTVIATHQTHVHGAMLEIDFCYSLGNYDKQCNAIHTLQVYSTPGDMADTADTADMVRFNFTF